MGAVDSFKDPSSDSVICSKNYIFNYKYDNRYLPKIILYMTLVDPSTWKYHVTISIALNLGKVKYISTFYLVVIFTACVFQCIKTSSFILIFFISLLITIVELYPLYINIQK